MDTAIIGFHSTIFILYLAYYFKFSEKGQHLFDESYELISDTKSSITGEIAEELTKLLKPIPDVLFIPQGTDKLEYKEGIPNPAKSERFKNWLDTYLEKHNSFFVKYYKTVRLYKKWKSFKSLLKILALVFSFIEVILVILTIRLSFFDFEKVEQTMKISAENKEYIFNTLIFSCALFFVALLLVMYVERIYSKLRNIKDKDVEF